MFGIEIRNAQADQFKTMVIRSSINALAFFGPRRYLDGCPVDHPGRKKASMVFEHFGLLQEPLGADDSASRDAHSHQMCGPRSKGCRRRGL